MVEMMEYDRRFFRNARFRSDRRSSSSSSALPSPSYLSPFAVTSQRTSASYQTRSEHFRKTSYHIPSILHHQTLGTHFGVVNCGVNCKVTMLLYREGKRTSRERWYMSGSSIRTGVLSEISVQNTHVEGCEPWLRKGSWWDWTTSINRKKSRIQVRR